MVERPTQRRLKIASYDPWYASGTTTATVSTGTFFRLISAVVAALYAAADEFTERIFLPLYEPTIGQIVHYIAQLCSYIWKPDANAALALDHFSRASVAHATAHDAPFKAFVARCKRHLTFIGSGFSPGASGKYLFAGV
jgi:hypothetical protein